MKYDLKEHGLIDEDGKVTLVGRIMLESALRTKAFLEGNSNEPMEEFSPKYSSCWGKDEEAVKNWEKDNNSLCLYGFSEGLIEVSPTRFYREENGKRIYDMDEFLCVVTVSDSEPSESIMYLWNKKDAIKLRDYLTKFIEKEEDWYKMPKNI
jgi:hypothetical protein